MKSDSLAFPLALAPSRYMVRVFGWMSAALGVTALSAFVVAGTPALAALILGNQLAFFGLLFLELGMVIYLTRSMEKMSLPAVQGAFLGYSVVNGLTLSVVFLVFTAESLASTFVITAGMFGATAAYGYFTRADLSRLGSLLVMALFGLIIAGVVNLFWANSALYWGTSVVGVLVFVGLTAYDMQKLKFMSTSGEAGTAEAEGKQAIRGALALYLDFLNMFLYLLRLFGRRR